MSRCRATSKAPRQPEPGQYQNQQPRPFIPLHYNGGAGLVLSFDWPREFFARVCREQATRLRKACE